MTKGRLPIEMAVQREWGEFINLGCGSIRLVGCNSKNTLMFLSAKYNLVSGRLTAYQQILDAHVLQSVYSSIAAKAAYAQALRWRTVSENNECIKVA